MKNYFLLLLTRLLRCFFRSTSPLPDHYLIVSTTGLGDTLWTTAAIRSMKQAKPSCFIAVLSSSTGCEVLKDNPDIQALFSFHASYGLLKQLRSYRFSTILLMHTSQRIVLPFVCLLGATSLIGTKNRQKGLDTLLTHAVVHEDQHELIRRLDLVKAAGIAKTTTTMVFSMPTPLKKQREIVLHLGAKDRFKKWPIAYFIQVGQLFQNMGYEPIFIPGDEKEQMILKKEGVPFTITHSLVDLATRFQKAMLIICNDSGPFHLSSALQCPVLGIFSPTDPRDCGPIDTPSSHVLFKKKTCTPCLRKQCQDPFCLLQISPEEVFKTALSILKIEEAKRID